MHFRESICTQLPGDLGARNSLGRLTIPSSGIIFGA
jgi:hypothetical protein